MKKTVTLLTALGLVGAFALIGPLSADPGNKYANTERTAACGDDGSMTVSINGPEFLWPPNHKYVPVVLTATDSDGDDVMLATEGTHDQYATPGDESTEENGAGNTTDDVSPLATVDDESGSTETASHEIRAERAGPDQDGRTYTITYEASGGTDDTCMDSFTILVPHDQSGGAGWKN